MTALRIDMKAFKEVCQSIRAEVKDGFKAENESIFAFYRWFVQDAEDKFIGVEPVDASDVLRDQLTVAAARRQQFGATQSQIDFIVFLAEKSGNFNVLGSAGTLTKTEASRIIENMKGK